MGGFFAKKSVAYGLRIVVVLVVVLLILNHFVDLRTFAGTFFNTTLTTNLNLEDGLVGHWTFDGTDVNTKTGVVIDRAGGDDIATSTGVGIEIQPATYAGSSVIVDLDAVDDDSFVLASGGSFTVYNVDGTQELGTTTYETATIGEDGGQHITMVGDDLVAIAYTNDDSGELMFTTYNVNTGSAQVSTTSIETDTNRWIDITAVDSDSVVIAYYEDNVTGGLYQVRNASTGASELAATTFHSGVITEAIIDTIDSDSVVIVYEDDSSLQIEFTVRNVSGAQELAPTLITSAQTEDIGMAMVDEDSFVVAYTNNDVGGNPLQMKVYNIDGTEELATTSVTSTINSDDVRVVRVDEDSFAVIWVRNGLHYRIFNLDGSLEVDTVQMGSVTGDFSGASILDGNIAAVTSNSFSVYTVGERPTSGIGRIGQAFSFRSGYVGVSTTPPVTAFPFTLSAWVNTSSSTEDQFIVSLNDKDDATNWQALRISSSTGFEASSRASSIQSASSTVPIVAGEWYHVTGVFTSASDRTLYVDGVLVNNDTTNAGSIETPDRISIGRNGDSDPESYFNGAIDDVRLYDRSLSSDEVERLYELGATTHINTSINTNRELQNGLLGHWTFDAQSVRLSSATTSIDAFTESLPDVALDAHTPNLGSGWTKLIETGTCDLLIENGVDTLDGGASSQCGTSEGALYRTNDIVTTPNYEVSVDQVNGDNADEQSWIACRIQDANNFYAFQFNEDAGQLHGVEGGTFTHLGSATAGIVNGSTVTLRCIDTTISVLDDGVELVTVENATNTYAGYAGVGMGDLEGGTDDIVIQELDNFSVVELPSILEQEGNTGHAGTPSTTINVVPGRIGQAVEFDGVSEFIDLGRIPELNVTEFTTALWVKGNSAPAAGGSVTSVFQKSSSDTEDQAAISLEWDHVGSAFTQSCGAYDGGFAVAQFGTPLEADTWYHLVCRWDGSDLKAYLNGVEDGSDPSSGLATGNSAFRIGAGGANGNSASRYFDGAVDDFRYYDRALSVDEIERLYQLGATTHINTSINSGPHSSDNLIGHWTFDGTGIDISSTTGEVIDSTGSTANGNWIDHATTTVIGQIGQALEFDGTDDIIDLGESQWDGSPANRTFAAWVFIEGDCGNPISGNCNGIVTKGTASSLGYALSLTEHDDVLMKINADLNGSSTRSVPRNGWHHVVAALDSSTTYYYIDGEAAGTDAFTYGGDNNHNFGIGGNFSGATPQGNFFNGKLDDVRIYDRTLSAEEVRRLYELGI